MQLYSSIAVPPYPPIMRMEVGEPGTTHDCLVRLRGDSFYDQPGDDYRYDYGAVCLFNKQTYGLQKKSIRIPNLLYLKKLWDSLSLTTW